MERLNEIQLRKLYTLPFASLSNEQLVRLTPDEIDRYTDIAIAEAGIVPWVGPTPVPPHALLNVKVNAYRVNGLIVGTREQAERLAGVLATCDLFSLAYANGRWSGPQYLKPNDREAIEIDEVSEMSEATMAATKFETERFDAAMTEYKKQREAFDHYNRKFSEAAQGVRDRIAEARAEHAEREQVRALYSHYLDIANLNPEIARNFLLKAKPHAKEQCPDLFDDSVAPPPARALRFRDDLQSLPAQATTPSVRAESDIPF